METQYSIFYFATAVDSPVLNAANPEPGIITEASAKELALSLSHAIRAEYNEDIGKDIDYIFTMVWTPGQTVQEAQKVTVGWIPGVTDAVMEILDAAMDRGVSADKWASDWNFQLSNN